MNWLNFFLNRFFSKTEEKIDVPVNESKASQLLLKMLYRNMVASGSFLPDISEVGFRNFSQTDEDGIILYIFSLIGSKSKTFIEIGAGNALESNCLNLAINFGWHGLFIDGDPQNVEHGRKFFSSHPDTKLYPPQFISAWVTKENINKTLKESGFKGEIDILSLDIDGMEYWIWDAITSVNPRLIVVEANNIYGEKSITVPYKSDWVYNAVKYPYYHGASLPALIKLGRKKGYRLIGMNKYEYNAFFLRNDIGKKVLPEISHNFVRKHKSREDDASKFKTVERLSFIKI